MRPMVEQSLSHLVMALQDPSVAVRDSHGMDGHGWKLGVLTTKSRMLYQKIRDFQLYSEDP